MLFPNSSSPKVIIVLYHVAKFLWQLRVLCSSCGEGSDLVSAVNVTQLGVIWGRLTYWPVGMSVGMSVGIFLVANRCRRTQPIVGGPVPRQG